MRDKLGRFTKDPFKKSNLIIFSVALAVLNIILLCVLIHLKDTEAFKREAIEKGYAIKKGKEFIWVDIRRAAIP